MTRLGGVSFIIICLPVKSKNKYSNKCKNFLSICGLLFVFLIEFVLY